MDLWLNVPIAPLDTIVYDFAHGQNLGASRASIGHGGCMDLNVRAFRTVQAALSEPIASDQRRESARKGGLVGGPSRARSISANRRSEIARKASAARWNKRKAEA